MTSGNACGACGASVRPGDSFCTRCGARTADPAAAASASASSLPVVPSGTAASAPAVAAAPRLRRPGLAAFLSLNVPGLGQLYNGETLRGLVQAALAVVLLGFGLYLPVLACIEETDRWRRLGLGLALLMALAVEIAWSTRQAYVYARANPVRPPAGDGDGALRAVLAVILVELLALVAVNGAFLYLARS